MKEAITLTFCWKCVIRLELYKIEVMQHQIFSLFLIYRVCSWSSIDQYTKSSYQPVPWPNWQRGWPQICSTRVQIPVGLCQKGVSSFTSPKTEAAATTTTKASYSSHQHEGHGTFHGRTIARSMNIRTAKIIQILRYLSRLCL